MPFCLPVPGVDNYTYYRGSRRHTLGRIIVAGFVKLAE